MLLQFCVEGDTKFAASCHEAFLEGQAALDYFLWNETAQYYNAYTTEGFDYEKFYHVKICGTSDEAAHADSKVGARGGKDPGGRPCVRGDPTTPGAIMTDSFYSQVGGIQQFVGVGMVDFFMLNDTGKTGIIY